MRKQTKKKFSILYLIILVILNTNIAYCDDINEGLRAILLGEYESGKILYEYNIDESVEIASITKIMTYLVTMDEITKGNARLDDVVTVSEKPPREGGTTFNLKMGEKINLKTLLDSILIVSANDSCVAIAEHIAGSEEQFVRMMNEKAEEIGLKNYHFINSNGLPEKKGQNKMSAEDIFRLSRHVISKYPQILNTTKMIQLRCDYRNINKENTNPLLKDMPDIDGLKTGYTNKAGYCLVSTLKVPPSENNDVPFRLIGIILGAQNEEARKNKSIQLLNYGIKNYAKKKVLAKDNAIKRIKIYDAKNMDVELYPSEDLYLLVKRESNIKKEIIVDEQIRAPISKGTKVGTVIVYVDGRKEGQADLLVNRNVERANILLRILRYIATLVDVFQYFHN